MSKAKVGDKFVIEVAEIIKGGETGCNQYRIKGFDKLFLDDKGLSFLESFDEDEVFQDGCLFGADTIWEFAHDIMEMPIAERAKVFNVSENTACFKDISEKFTVGQAMAKYNDYRANIDVQQALSNLVEKYDFSLDDLKNALNSFSKK